MNPPNVHCAIVKPHTGDGPDRGAIDRQRIGCKITSIQSINKKMAGGIGISTNGWDCHIYLNRTTTIRCQAPVRKRK